MGLLAPTFYWVHLFDILAFRDGPSICLGPVRRTHCPAAHLPKKISCPYRAPRGKLAVRCTLLRGVGEEFPWGSPIKPGQRKYPFISFDSLLQRCLNRCILVLINFGNTYTPLSVSEITHKVTHLRICR